MLAYLIRRTFYIIPIVLGVTLITFVLFNVVGGNPVYMKLGKHGTEAEVKNLEHQLGLDRPLHEQYFFFLSQIIRITDTQSNTREVTGVEIPLGGTKELIVFDFGRSWSSQQKISQMLNDGVGPSLSLAIPAFSVSVFLSILIALILAFYRRTFLDKGIVVLCLALMSISVLAYIIYFQYVFAYKWDMFPISGYEGTWSGRWNFVLLPGIIWVITSLGPDVLLYRTTILDEVFQDYVRTARAKGLSEKLVMLKHVLKNALIPIITNVLMEIPYLYTGSLLLESFFGIPGLGGMTVQALNNSDFPVVKAMTVIGSLLYIIFNLISDICYALVDPRVKLG